MPKRLVAYFFPLVLIPLTVSKGYDKHDNDSEVECGPKCGQYHRHSDFPTKGRPCIHIGQGCNRGNPNRVAPCRLILRWIRQKKLAEERRVRWERERHAFADLMDEQ